MIVMLLWPGLSLLLCLTPASILADGSGEAPNIIFILADDLGYNDIGYTNDEVISPNLDQLAADGRIFTHNYVMPMCTPSRHALMTGIYPYKSAMQHLVLAHGRCSPTDLTFLPERLQSLGYETALIGKWHLGECQDQCMPMSRGYDTQYGIMTGAASFTDHISEGYYDFRSQDVTDWGASGSYMTELLGTKADSIIRSSEKPLFIYLAFTAVHTPLEAPQEYLDMYPDVDEPRKTYLGEMTAMDDEVGKVVQALKDTGKWDNTLIIFSADNGGEIGDASDNSPFRGCKFSLWEGGTRVVGFVSGPLVKNAGNEHDGFMHVVDWTPTLLHVAGGDPDTVSSLDGVDQYDMVINGGDSARTGFIYNIDIEDYAMNGHAAVRSGDFKLIWGHEGICDGYGLDIKKFWLIPEQCALAGIECPDVISSSEHDYTDEEVEAQNAIINAKAFTVSDLSSGTVHLYNLKDDPYEENDLAGDSNYADKLNELKQQVVDEINNNYVQPFLDTTVDMTPEENPDDPDGVKGLGIGWCPDTDNTMP